MNASLSLDALRQFRDAICAVGLQPPREIVPGKIHRFPGAGKHKGNTAGWCKFFLDGLGGVFGDFSRDMSADWQAKRDKPFTPAELEVFKRQVAEAKVQADTERKARQEEAASRAAAIWQAAPPAPDDHPYLVHKRVKAHDVKLDDGRLVIPARDADRAIHSLQYIDAEGHKQFLPGGGKKGHFHLIGEPANALLVCEGYATGASLHEATGCAVAVAFDAGNLLHVATKVRARYPGARMVLCADNDQWGEKNTGVLSANAAAEAVKGLVAIPQFDDTSGKPTDFNDLARLSGLDAVKRTIDLVLADDTASGWEPPIDLWGKVVAPVAKREFFPRTIADYAFEVAEVSGFDPGFVAMTAMVAAAGAIDDRIVIECKRNDPTFVQAARLWLMLVGSPSVKKTPVRQKVFARLFSIEEALRDQYGNQLKVYERAMLNWKAECRRADKAGSPLPDAPLHPVLTRLVVDDTTPERLQTVLAHNARGVIQVRDELSGWFGSMGAYGAGDSVGKDQAHWLQLYDGGPRMFDRQGRDDVFVPNWSASVMGTIQPDSIRRIASRLPNDGLMQRFIAIIGERHDAVDRHIDLSWVTAFEDLLDRLYGTPPGYGPLLLRAPVTMSIDADTVRKRVFGCLGGLIRAFEDGSPRLASHIGKWEGLYCRLLLVVHCIECAERGVHPASVDVPVESAVLVENLMMKYLLGHLKCFYESVLEEGSSPAPDSCDLMDDVKKLGEHILTKAWTTIADSTVTRAVKRWRHRTVKQKAERYSAMEAMGWLAPASEPDKRGLAPRYLVNPAVHTTFKGRAASFANAMKAIADVLKGPGEATT